MKVDLYVGIYIFWFIYLLCYENYIIVKFFAPPFPLVGASHFGNRCDKEREKKYSIR